MTDVQPDGGVQPSELRWVQPETLYHGGAPAAFRPPVYVTIWS